MSPDARNSKSQLADKRFEDCIVLADGDRALDDMRFWITREEFDRESYPFDKKFDGGIYGILLLRITEEYKEDGRPVAYGKF